MHHVLPGHYPPPGYLRRCAANQIADTLLDGKYLHERSVWNDYPDENGKYSYRLYHTLRFAKIDEMDILTREAVQSAVANAKKTSHHAKIALSDRVVEEELIHHIWVALLNLK